MASATAWEAGRLDAGRGPPRVLFGRMYEDPEIEHAAFAPGGRVFCIASAGCTAMRLAPYLDIGFRHLVAGMPATYDEESMTRLITDVKPILERGG